MDAERPRDDSVDHRRALRRFTEAHAPEERKRTAGEVRAERRAYFQRQAQLTADIAALERRARELREHAEEVAWEFRALQRELHERRDGFVVALLTWRTQRRIEVKIAEREITSEQLGYAIAEAEQQIARLRAAQDDRRELAVARARLDAFYGAQEAAWEEYREDRRVRDVGSIARERAVAFIHGIHPRFTPKENSLLGREVDWETKLKILLALEPTLSTSTVRAGDGPERMWARMGVILTGGTVRDASPVDAGTRAISLTERTTDSDGRPAEVRERITRAINHAGGTRAYNELVVEEPRVAGMYICTDGTGRVLRDDLVPSAEIAAAAGRFGLPLYAISEGRVHSASFDAETNELATGEEVNSEALTAREFTLPEGRREQLIDELFTDPPFKVRSPDIQHLTSRDDGRTAYLELSALRNPDALEGATVAYDPFPRESGAVIQTGERVTFLGAIDGIGRRTEYFQRGGKTYRRTVRKGTEGVFVTDVRWEQDLGKGIVRTAGGLEFTGLPITDAGAYLAGVAEKLRELTVKLAAETDALEPDLRAFAERRIRNLAANCYGFAEEAERRGDAETAARARDIAASAFPRDAYDDLLARRIDARGRLKITREDLR